MKRTDTKKKPSRGGVQRGNQVKPEKVKPAHAQGLRDLFVEGLKDIYWVEKALVKAIPAMIAKATSEDLVEALTEHFEATQEHVLRLEEIFSSIGEKLVAKKCVAVEDLIKKIETIIQDTKEGVVRDAGIISAGQKVEHYEIAVYGTLCAFAKSLGEEEAVALLQDTLDEEKEIDERLSEIAESDINDEASDFREEEYMDEE